MSEAEGTRTPCLGRTGDFHARKLLASLLLVSASFFAAGAAEPGTLTELHPSI
jgi:hypothetical protein